MAVHVGEDGSDASDDESGPQRYIASPSGNGSKSTDGSTADSENMGGIVVDILQEGKGESSGAGGKLGVGEGDSCDLSGSGGCASVESHPAEPEQTCSDEGHADAGRAVFIHFVFALA